MANVNGPYAGIRSNPIYYVRDKNGDNVIGAVPPPSSFQWKMQDVSAPDAGRSEAGVMDKARIGQVVALELSWQNVTTAVANEILNAFQPEYVTVRYTDPLFGTSSTTYYYVTKTFYVGDRSAPMYNSKQGLWSNISFNLIEQTCTNP